MTRINLSSKELYKTFKFISYSHFNDRIKVLNFLKTVIIENLSKIMIKYNIFLVFNQLKTNYQIDDYVCSICLIDINKPIFLHCGHHFHQDCILKWLDSKNTCPMCRINIY